MSWIIAIVGVIILLIGFSVLFGAPYVPSHRRFVGRAFVHFGVGKDDSVVDLGSGDGVVLREALRRGAKATGYEIHPLLVLIARLTTGKGAKILLRDYWSAQFPADTTVLYMFGVKRDGKRLEAKLSAEATRLRRPLRLICYGNALPTLKPVETFEAYFLYQFDPLHHS